MAKTLALSPVQSMPLKQLSLISLLEWALIGPVFRSAEELYTGSLSHLRFGQLPGLMSSYQPHHQQSTLYRHDNSCYGR